MEGIMDIVPVSDETDILQLRLTCQSSMDLRKNIYQKIKQTDWILLEFYQETKTLENIFRELTQEN